LSFFPAFAEDSIGKMVAWYTFLAVEEDGPLGFAVGCKKGCAGGGKQVILGIATDPTWINLVSGLAASASAS
jgi:hypothetical protein